MVGKGIEGIHSELGNVMLHCQKTAASLWENYAVKGDSDAELRARRRLGRLCGFLSVIQTQHS